MSLEEFKKVAIEYIETGDPVKNRYISDSIAEAILRDDPKTIHEMKIILGRLRRERDEDQKVKRIWGFETVLSHYELFKARELARKN